MKTLKIVVQALWALSLIVLGTLIGASVGLTNHGWHGAIVVGTIGFAVGAFLASSPSLFLQLLRWF
jgi:hypothetical protein